MGISWGPAPPQPPESVRGGEGWSLEAEFLTHMLRSVPVEFRNTVLTAMGRQGPCCPSPGGAGEEAAG